jgi:hypothetical protein
MAVYWNRRPGFGLWVVSLEPYSETPLLPDKGPGQTDPFGWSPDGKYVYGIRRREILKVGLANPNQPISVATLPGDVVEGLSASMSPTAGKSS